MDAGLPLPLFLSLSLSLSASCHYEIAIDTHDRSGLHVTESEEPRDNTYEIIFRKGPAKLPIVCVRTPLHERRRVTDVPLAVAEREIIRARPKMAERARFGATRYRRRRPRDAVAAPFDDVATLRRSYVLRRKDATQPSKKNKVYLYKDSRPANLSRVSS